jgi:hypothetical protein
MKSPTHKYRCGDQKTWEMYVVSDATISYRKTKLKSCKTFELGFFRLVEVGEGRRGEIK